MRKFERVDIDADDFATLSLVPWGTFRRWLAGRKSRRLGVSMKFIPKYELAVFHRHPNCTLPNIPDLVFRFPNRVSAELGYHRVANALMEGGYDGEPVRRLMEENGEEWLG
jgi:hypothetical protein